MKVNGEGEEEEEEEENEEVEEEEKEEDDDEKQNEEEEEENLENIHFHRSNVAGDQLTDWGTDRLINAQHST